MVIAQAATVCITLFGLTLCGPQVPLPGAPSPSPSAVITSAPTLIPTQAPTVYTSDSPMSVLYQSDGDASLNDGIAMMETTVDPATAPNGVTYTGTYSWLGTSDPNAMNAQIFTVWVQ